MDVFVKSLDDDSPPRSVVSLDGAEWVTHWPSDTLIVFESGTGGEGNLWYLDLSDPDSVTAASYLSSEADLRDVVISPDGTLAAYRSNETGGVEIYVRSFPEPGEPTIVSQGGGAEPFWSPDGNTLYYVRGSLEAAVFVAARIQRNPVPVVLSRDSLFTATRIVRPLQGSGLHPDGDRFILAQSVGAAAAEGAESEPDRLILITDWFEELRRRTGSN